MIGVLQTEMAALASLELYETRFGFLWGVGQAVKGALHGRICSWVGCQDKELILFWVSWCQEQWYGAHQI